MACQEWVQSPFRTIFESLICLALVGSYVPQYIVIGNHGTSGISSWFILFTILFATTQFATYLLNETPKAAFLCVNGSELRGFQAFSALLGFFQAAVQWLCAIVILIFYLKYYTPQNGNSPLRQMGNFSRPIKPPTLRTIIVTYNIITLSIGFSSLWRPDWTEDNFNREFFWRLFEMAIGSLWVLSLIILVLLQYIPQILTNLSLRTRGSIGIVSLGFQIVVFIVLGIAQAFRLGIPPRERSQPPRTLLQLYCQIGHLWVNYIITSLGQVALLVVCLYVDWGRIRQSGALRL